MHFPWASRAKIGQVSGGNGQGPAFFSASLEISWTLFISFSNAARPLGVAVLSRISASLPTYSPIVFRFLNGHPFLKPGQFPAIPFISSARALYGHTPLPKTGHFLRISSTVKEYGHCGSKCKVKLETRIFTRNRYTTAQINQPWAITFLFTSGNRFFRMIHVSRFALKVGKTSDSDNCLTLFKKLGNEKKFPHLSCTLESSFYRWFPFYVFILKPKLLTTVYAGFKISLPAASLAKGQPPLKELWGETVPYSTCFSLVRKWTSFKNSIHWASPLDWSRIWPIMSWSSPTVLHCLKGQPLLKGGHLAQTPFFSWASLAYGQPPPKNAGQCFDM